MNKLRFWRLERGLSQIELSAASGVPRWAIQLSEQGLRPLSEQEREVLALVIGVETKKLFPAEVKSELPTGA